MKKSILPITATAAVVAAALCGCEWGGVHSGESWNDAYSWANFSGTYKLVTTVTATGGSGSSSTTTTTSTSTTGGSGSGGSSSGTTVVYVSTTNKFSKSFNYSAGASTYYNTGVNNVTPGSVNVSLGDGFVDQGGGVLKYNGAGSISGSVNYQTGAVVLNVASSMSTMWNGRSFTITGTYVTTKAQTTTTSSGDTTNNGDGTTTTTTTTTTTNADGTTSSSSTSTKTSYIQWLNLTQKGNLLTFKDNYGTTYSGRITGASCPTANESGYITAAHIRFPFEATCTSDSRITLSGSLSGDWSGGSSATSGTLANRAIDATYHTGKSAAQFQAVSGTVNISAQEIAPYAGTTN